MDESFLPIREFSLHTGIRRETLRFYDQIGLLCPESRGANNYRYYTARQIDLALLISELRALGVGLEEIKRYADERSPARMLALFSQQDAHIEAEIKRLRALQEVMRLRSHQAELALRYGDGAVFLEERDAEPIFLCQESPAGSTEMETLTQPYDYAYAQGVDLSFPIGAVLPSAALESGGWLMPLRYFFKISQPCNAQKEAGTYAVYYGLMSGGNTAHFLAPLLAFLRANGLRAVGDTYEEYPLDELCAHAWEQYMHRVEVRVEPE